eukprot:PhM_4_TR17404/c0_g1_i12/m.69803
MAQPPHAQQALTDEAVEAFVDRLRREINLCEVPVRIGWRPCNSQGAFAIQKGVASSKTRSREVINVTLRQEDNDNAIPQERIKTKRFPFVGYEYSLLEINGEHQAVLVSDEEEADEEDNGEDEPMHLVLHDVKTWQRLLETEAGTIGLKNYLQGHEELGLRDPTSLQRQSYAALEGWMELTSAIGDWHNCPHFTKLGNTLVELLRYQQLDRSSGQAETVKRALYGETHPMTSGA